MLPLRDALGLGKVVSRTDNGENVPLASLPASAWPQPRVLTRPQPLRASD